MAAVAPLVGVGAGIASGISGKGAAKRQERLQREQFNLIKPLLQKQADVGQSALKNYGQLYGLSVPQIQGGEAALRDSIAFRMPERSGDRGALLKRFAPEIRQVNEGYRTAAENIAKFAPRGGGAAAARYRGDISRQGALSDLFFKGRSDAADKIGQLGGQLGQLGLGTGGYATSTLGAGLSAGQQGTSIYNQQNSQAYQARQNSGADLSGLGGYLVDLFKGVKLGGGGGKSQPSISLDDFARD